MAPKVTHHVTPGVCYTAILAILAFSFALDLLMSIHGSRVFSIFGW